MVFLCTADHLYDRWKAPPQISLLADRGNLSITMDFPTDRQRRPETGPETIVNCAETQRPYIRGSISNPNIMVSASLRILSWSLDRSLEVSDGLWKISKTIMLRYIRHIVQWTLEFTRIVGISHARPARESLCIYFDSNGFA